MLICLFSCSCLLVYVCCAFGDMGLVCARVPPYSSRFRALPRRVTF